MIIDDIRSNMELVEKLSETLGEKIDESNYEIEDMGCPHKQPKGLKNGYGAIYIFALVDNGYVEFIKIGKANEKSSPRFVSQHYGLKAPSTLAKSLCADEYFKSRGVNEENVKEWMLTNLYRINIRIKASKAATELIESIFHYAYRPRFEGNI